MTSVLTLDDESKPAIYRIKGKSGGNKLGLYTGQKKGQYVCSLLSEVVRGER